MLSADLTRSTYITVGNLLYSKPVNLNVNLIQKAPWKKHLEKCLARYPGAMAQPKWHGRLTIGYISWFSGASLVAQTVKNLPAMQATWVPSLGQEDSLEKGMATHSSILAWRILWTEEAGGLQSMGSQRVRHDWATNFLIQWVWHGSQILHF